jgi:hypothetical protein
LSLDRQLEYVLSLNRKSLIVLVGRGNRAVFAVVSTIQCFGLNSLSTGQYMALYMAVYMAVYMALYMAVYMAIQKVTLTSIGSSELEHAQGTDVTNFKYIWCTCKKGSV